MVRCRSLQQKESSRGPLREALLAATLIHLLPGDLLSTSAGDAMGEKLAPEGKHHQPAGTFLGGDAMENRLQICAAAARGLQAAGADGVVLAFAGAGGPERGWMEALEWAQESQLPLLLACSDATNGAGVGRAKGRGSGHRLLHHEPFREASSSARPDRGWRGCRCGVPGDAGVGVASAPGRWSIGVVGGDDSGSSDRGDASIESTDCSSAQLSKARKISLKP